MRGPGGGTVSYTLISARSTIDFGNPYRFNASSSNVISILNSANDACPGKLPSGGQWLHEIKHDGFRIIARKDGQRVRLYSRPGNDLTRRFPLIVETLARLRSRSCIIDGEAVACDDNGVASFDLVRHQRANESIFLYASTSLN